MLHVSVNKKNQLIVVAYITQIKNHVLNYDVVNSNKL